MPVCEVYLTNLLPFQFRGIEKEYGFCGSKPQKRRIKCQTATPGPWHNLPKQTSRRRSMMTMAPTEKNSSEAVLYYSTAKKSRFNPDTSVKKRKRKLYISLQKTQLESILSILVKKILGKVAGFIIRRIFPFFSIPE